MKRGEIYFIERGYQEEGSEQRAGRPAIIVSNDKCNENSSVVEVVYLTSQPKTDLPTHVDIRSTPKVSIALCEQINSIYKDRIGDYIGNATDYEMMMIDAALAISLDLKFEAPKKTQVVNNVVSLADRKEQAGSCDNGAERKRLEEEIIKLKTERDTFEALYNGMLDRLVAAK